MKKIGRKVWTGFLLVATAALTGLEIFAFIDGITDGTLTIKSGVCLLLGVLFFGFLFGAVFYYGILHPEEIDDSDPDMDKANEMFLGKTKWQIIKAAFLNAVWIGVFFCFFDWLSDSTIHSFFHYVIKGVAFSFITLVVYGALYLYRRHRN